MRSSLLPVLLLACLFSGWLQPTWADEDEPRGGPSELKHLKFRPIGPATGGRVSRAAGVAGDPLVYYAATAAGGVWKSSDGGLSWKPIFDEQPISSIGSLAVAPSDANVIYVGSGEANIRGNVAAGNGIYKSTDAGRTWKHVWKQEGQIGTIIVHPRNPAFAFAAVLGHAFGPNLERGVYRTTDGGATWKQVLAKNADTGASDVCFDPSNPHILFAGLWQTRRRPWELTSGGPGSGLYVSRDGGDTWRQLTGKGKGTEESSEYWGKGLPEGIWGKVGVAVAPSDGRRVYALIEAEKGGLYRSDDGGKTWRLANDGRYLRQRAWYYTTLTIDPQNPNVIWCPQVRMLKSIDGGKTFTQALGFHHGDHHDLWIDPRNPKRMIDSNDGGVDVSSNGGETWYAPPLPIAQFYHITVDNRTPYHVSGAMQDVGTAQGPSNSLSTAGISTCDWHDVGGGEAGHTASEPSDPNIVYAGEYGGYITRYDHGTRQSRNVSIYPTNPSGHGAEDLRYRFQWTAPIMISPHNAEVIYHAANVLFRTTDGGQHWTAISPDLTRNDRTKQRWSGGPITGDNTGAEYYDTIFAVAESPKQKGVLWTGSDDGLVHVSRDGGEHWSNVTNNLPRLPEWATIDCIEASPFDAGTAYVVADAHRLDVMQPYLYKTSDYGATWKSLAGSLPQDVYLHAVREDPKHRGLLFAGTERGVSFSTNDGETWQQLKLNLPTVAVHDLVVKDNDLVVGTNGRSIWIFDDLTPIRALGATLASKEPHLFPVQPAIRWRYHSPVASVGPKSAGKNPPAGAIINYFLVRKPIELLTLEVLDSQGKLVITLRSKTEEEEKAANEKEREKTGKEPKVDPNRPEDKARKEVTPPTAGAKQHRKEKEKEEEIPEEDPDAPSEREKKTVLTTELGVNRIAWNLHYEGAETIQGAKVDAGNPKAGPLVNPGTYTLKLTVDGKTLTTTLEVKPDRRLHIAEPDLAQNLMLALMLRDDLSRLSRLVGHIRAVKKQLSGRNELLDEDEKAQPVIQLAQALSDKLDALESKLHNPTAKVTYDILAQRGGAKLYSLMSALYDWVKDSDGAPTQGMWDVYGEQRAQLNDLQAELNTLLTKDLARLNKASQDAGIPGVIVPAKEATGKR